MASSKKYEVILTENAKIELREIYDYISKSLMAEMAAKSLYNKIKESILRLEDFPESCSIIEHYKDKKYQYRKLIINNYIVVYRIDKENKKVYIVRIIFGKRNYINEI